MMYSSSDLVEIQTYLGHKDKNYRLLCQIIARCIHFAPSLNPLYIREHLIIQTRFLAWFTQFYSFRFHHPVY